MYIKEFDDWTVVKKRINIEERKVNARAGDIRWISFGVNVGSEMDGKGPSYTRPGLIVNVIGSHYALVVPTSTKIRQVPGYISLNWNTRPMALCIHQMRVVSSKRILNRIGKISERKLEEHKKHITAFFSL